MADHERPAFLRTPPVHFDFLRTLDELATSRLPRCTEESAYKPLISPPYDEERRTWHRPDLSGAT